MPRLVAAACGLVLVVQACAETAPAIPTTTTVAVTTTRFPLTTTSTAIPTTTRPPAAVASTSRPPTTTTTTLAPLQTLAYETVVSEGIEQPVAMVTAPGDPRLYIVERRGVIKIYDPRIGLLDAPFADLRERVGASGIEMGLLGLAFHPEYVANGRFFVYYTDPSTDSHLVELAASSKRDAADPGFNVGLLHFEQPTNRHNGGMLQFGPDGYLWLSLGEGGKASEHAQHPETLLASILRLDVDDVSLDAAYAIPRDNPFADGIGGAPEVWAYGLRNPWRFSIDSLTRLLYISDVGQAAWEEIDVVSIDDHSGHNFGWLPMEGFECFLSNCNPGDFTLPVLVYDHSEGCSITGGHVYRGPAIPELAGHYLYSDWCSGFLRSITIVDGETAEFDWTDRVGVAGQITAFGVDADGEIYILTWAGEILKLVAVR